MTTVRHDKNVNNNKSRQYGFDTLSIHGGIRGKNPCNSLNAPIFQTSTFTFDSMEHVDRVMSFESDDYVYTRGNNPTLRIFEDKMTVLEEGEGAVAFASGMAAISSVLFSLLKPSDNVIVHKTLYGSSYNVVTKVLPQYGIGYKAADLKNPECLADLIDENTRAVYFETPSNPNLDVIDIRKVVEQAGKRKVKVVIDNTFATPFFQKPLNLGADVVVHSTTKYLCGHGDAIGGVAVSKDTDYVHKLKFDYMSEFGGVMSPFNAWLLLRGIKTLGVRMRQHEKNALEIAEYLHKHPKIKEVMYPGLESFRGHSTAKKQMSGYGAMISFEVDGGIKEAKKLVDNMRLAKIAVSLGDCESLIEVPAAMTHRGYPRERLEQFGLTESMVRISVGLENAEDIIDDFEQALRCL